MAKTAKAALRDTLPVMAGYVVLGAGFGILMQVRGYGALLAIGMSVFLYAGSMQYLAVELFAVAAGPVTAALTTLAVNARHLFYGISMLERYRDAGARKPYLVLALTDETYSLLCTGEGDLDYCFLVTLFDHLYWIAGTALGVLLGGAVQFNTAGVDFALTALFLTIFTDQWIKNRRHFPAVAGVLATLACLLVFGRDDFLLPAMAVITAALLLRRGKEDADAG